jgi:hypothetical protein
MSTMSITPVFTVRPALLSDAAEALRVDAFVQAHPHSTPFHATGWARAIQRACGQNAHYLIAEDGNGAIAAVLPLTEVKSALFGKALVSSGFAVDGGVLSNSPEASRLLTAAALNYAKNPVSPQLNCAEGIIPRQAGKLTPTPISVLLAIWPVMMRQNCLPFPANNGPKSAKHWDLI